MSLNSSIRVFRVRADHARFPDKWFLDEPLSAKGDEIDAREFTEGALYQGIPPARVPIGNPGQEVAFNLAAFDMPVVSTRVAEAVSRIAADDVQFFPVEIPGAREEYQILNAVHSLDCLDETRSEFTRWQEGDHRSDLIGQYRMISTIRIDPARTRNHQLFRIKNWPMALLVSEKVVNALGDTPDLGVVFEPAS
jgi:Immunity protein family (Imm11)